MCGTVCPTRYRTRLAGGPLLCVATIRRTTDTFLFITHVTNVLLFKFRCNIVISVRITKEMPGSVPSGTHCRKLVGRHFRQMMTHIEQYIAVIFRWTRFWQIVNYQRRKEDILQRYCPLNPPPLRPLLLRIIFHFPFVFFVYVICLATLVVSRLNGDDDRWMTVDMKYWWNGSW